MKLTSFDEHLAQQLKTPAFKKEWERTEPLYQVVRLIIRERIAQDISQKELAERAHTTQAVISRIESLSVNPSILLLDRIAKALNKDLIFELK